MIVSVTQFNNFVRALYESEPMLNNLRVKGEICNCKYSGEAVYFGLKDEACLMDCFAYASSLKGEIKNGETAVVTGRPNYLRSGRFSFTVNALSVEDNRGDLYKKFLELKDKLDAEGCFASENKKVLPRFCFEVGVITSVYGAVIEDIKKVAARRCPYLNLTFFPARVQGAGAADDITEGLNYFSESGADAVIIARGGGSFEDLAPFNTESVVRAVVRCKLPVISAVGHETDFTLCDLAADIRAATPSVAAELVTANNAVTELKFLSQRIVKAVAEKATDYKRLVCRLSEDLIDGFSAKLIGTKKSLGNLSRSIRFSAEKLVMLKEARLESEAQKIKMLSPLKILEKGYAVVLRDGKKVFSPDDARDGEKLKLILRDGTLGATVVK